MKKQRIENVQSLRGIAVLLVVFFHLMSVEEVIGYQSRLLPGWFEIGISGVDLFFVISGFVMVVVTRGKFQQPAEMRRFLFNRMTRIYPMYWIFSLLLIAAFMAIGSNALAEDNLFCSLFLIPQVKGPLLAVGWTLIHEVYFYLVFTLLLFAPEKYLARMLVGWGALVLVVNLSLKMLGKELPSPALRVAVNPMTLEFIMGALVAIFLFRQAPGRGGWVFGCGVGLLAAGGGIYHALQADTLLGDWARVILMGVPAVLVLAGAVIIEGNNARTFPRLLVIVGDASYSIYLSHLLVMFTIGRLYQYLIVPSDRIEPVVSIAMFASAMIVGVASYRFVEKPLMMRMRRQ